MCGCIAPGMCLGYFAECRYWWTSINRYVAGLRPLKWTNKWVFNVWGNGVMLGARKLFPPGISSQFPPSRPKKSTALISHFREHTMTFVLFWDGILNAYATTKERPEIHTIGTIEPNQIKNIVIVFFMTSVYANQLHSHMYCWWFSVLAVSTSVWHGFECVCSAVEQSNWAMIREDWANGLSVCCLILELSHTVLTKLKTGVGKSFHNNLLKKNH